MLQASDLGLESSGAKRSETPVDRSALKTLLPNPERIHHEL
jgi:hypothetical protein